MSNVTIRKYVIVRSDDGNFSVARGAVDCYILAKSISTADFHTGHSSLPFQILSLKPDAGKRENLIVFTKRSVPVNHHVGMQVAAPAHYYIFANDTIRTNVTVRPDLGFRMNDSGWMYHWVSQRAYRKIV